MKSQFFIYIYNKLPETGSDSLLCVSICNREYVRAVGVGTRGQDFDNQLTLSQPGGADNAHQTTASDIALPHPPSRFLDLPTAPLRHPPTSF